MNKIIKGVIFTNPTQTPDGDFLSVSVDIDRSVITEWKYNPKTEEVESDWDLGYRSIKDIRETTMDEFNKRLEIAEEEFWS